MRSAGDPMLWHLPMSANLVLKDASNNPKNASLNVKLGVGEVTSSPPTPLVLRKQHHRKQSPR